VVRIIRLAGIVLLASALAACTKKDEGQMKNEVTTPSGLKYVDIIEGSGEEAKPGDKAQVHYSGWFYTNGKRGEKFDSSEGATPFELTIGAGQVIKGWDEGLQGMKVGGKRELIIPPELGYGQRGYPGAIPPNAMLNFEVELVKLSK